MPKAAGSENTRKAKGKTGKTSRATTSPVVPAVEPPAKKARTTASASASSSKGKRGSKKGKAKEQEERGRLWNIFEQLSVDAIYTIFSHLQPTDLLRLARTSRLLRSHLMSKSSTAVWKVARLRAERQIPECPPDQSEPQWAYLLYIRDCSFCDKTKIPTIDWEHRVRLCAKCSWSGKIMMLRQNAAKTLPHVEDLDVVLDLLPSWIPTYSVQMYYPIEAVKKLAARYAAIKAQGNQEELDEFKEQMLVRRKAIVDSVKGFQEWEKGSSVENTNRRIVSEKFEVLGYLPVDIRDPSVRNSTFVNTRTLLTEARWATVRPHLEALVNQAKQRRVARHRFNTIVQRRQLVQARIQGYFDQRPRLEAAFRPTSLEVLTKFSVFKDIIEQPNEAVVLAESFDPAMEALPSLLKEYADPKKRLLVHRMVEGGARNVSDPPAEEDLGKVFYATTVFFSKTSKLDIPICVDSEFKMRMCWLFNVGSEAVDGTCRHLTFNSKASDAVGALLRCARLEYTTTAEDMDALDLRFYCLGCEGRERKLARSWRDCAQHATEAKHNTDNWKLLAHKTASRVRVAESSNLNDGRPRFYCNLCGLGGQFRNHHSLGDLVEHLKTRHWISDPLEQLDESVFSWNRTIPPEPVIL